MNKKFPVFSTISISISILAIVMYGFLFTDLKKLFYIPWIIFGTISFFFPILSKYMRKRFGQSGQIIETIAFILGWFSFDWILYITLTKSSLLNIAFCILPVTLYFTLFKNVTAKEQCLGNDDFENKKMKLHNKFLAAFIIISAIAILSIPMSVVQITATWDEAIEMFWSIWFFVLILFDIVCLAVYITNICVMQYRKTVRYREKCYKRVEKMKRHLENGIITQEEFEKNKADIIKNIHL